MQDALDSYTDNSESNITEEENETAEPTEEVVVDEENEIEELIESIDNEVTETLDNVEESRSTTETTLKTARITKDVSGLVTGWVKDELNNYYLFEWEKTLNQGMMVVGWRKVNGKYYYFSPIDGKLLTYNFTPDGYLVDGEGVYIENNK